MPDNRVFVVAELSANHGHRLETALATVRAAKASGADAVKTQTYTPDTLTLDCDSELFQITQGTIWDGTTLYRLYQEAYTPWEWLAPIRDEARACGLVFFSAAFDHSAVDFLETLDNPIYKIASFEINDIPLIEYAASKGKPMMLSTGVATLEEIQEAVAACRRVGNSDVTLLKCTSSYPAPVEKANLRTIPDMARRFGVRVGLSDHTRGSLVALGAVALGATVVEKHFILDRSIGGPDATFSMTPQEFSEMSQSIRATELALGSVQYDLDDAARRNTHFKRSLFVVRDVESGEVFTRENLRSIRPSSGLPPVRISDVLGRRAARDIRRGTPLADDLIARD
jgi:pseudaminic acid synthase